MEFFNELLAFIGRWHPLFVHLPIGMLFLAFIMSWVVRYEKYSAISDAIPFTLLLGTIAALMASVTGYLLSLDGGYELETLNLHKWLGIAVALLSLFVYLLYREGLDIDFIHRVKPYRFFVFTVIIILLGLTGHYGGTLTHGKGYLKEALPTVIKNAVGITSVDDMQIPPLDDAQEALVYEEIVHPILAQRCQSCHGAKKQEGGLALHDKASLLKGGEDGFVLTAGDLEKSELYARLILPVGHERRMPPKGRKPITNEQIKLIGWWISTGAKFDSKAKDLEQTDDVIAALKLLEEGGESEAESEYAYFPEAIKLPEDVVQKLQAKGIKVLPIADNNHYVVINTINYPQFSDQDLLDLLSFKDNIVQLKIGNSSITNSSLEQIATFPYLLKLHLEHTAITDEGLKLLKGHERLKYINLFGANVSDEGMTALRDIPNLKHIYAYQTKVSMHGVDAIRKGLPTVRIDTGQYVLPFLDTDTIIY